MCALYVAPWYQHGRFLHETGIDAICMKPAWMLLTWNLHGCFFCGHSTCSLQGKDLVRKRKLGGGIAVKIIPVCMALLLTLSFSFSLFFFLFISLILLFPISFRFFICSAWNIWSVQTQCNKMLPWKTVVVKHSFALGTSTAKYTNNHNREMYIWNKYKLHLMLSYIYMYRWWVCRFLFLEIV